MTEKQDTRFLSKDFIKDFLEQYKSHECLWKIKSKEYLNKNLKSEAYEKLVVFCRQTYANADIKFVKNKIQSLRNSFRKEMRKVNESKRSGKGTEDIYEPVLWYYKLLLFTKDQELPDESIENIPENVDTEVCNEDSISKDTEESQVTEDIEETETNDTEGNLKEKTRGKTNDTPVFVKNKMSKPSESKRKRTIEEDFLQTCMESLKRPCESSTCNDEFTAVGANLSAKLRMMNFSQRILAESLVQQIITKGLFNELTKNTVVVERPAYNNYEVNYSNTPSSLTSTPLPSPINPEFSSDSTTHYYENIGNTLHLD